MSKKQDKLLHTFSYCLNPNENGGESLTLVTKYFDNGDKKDKKGIYVNQTLSLQSYGNSANFELCGSPLDSEILRDLANKLDKSFIKAQTEKPME